MLQGVWDLPGSRTEPVFPALAGRFFTTKAAGKPRCSYSWKPHSLPGQVPPSLSPGRDVCVCECPSHQAQPTKVGPLPWRGPTVQRNSVNSPWGEESGGPGLSSTVRVGGFPRPGLSALKAPPVSSPPLLRAHLIRQQSLLLPSPLISLSLQDVRGDLPPRSSPSF